MSRSRWLTPIALLLLVVMLLTGCASAQPRGVDDGAVAVSTDADGAQKAHGGGDARTAILVFACILLVFTVIVDVIILPCTAPYSRPFCCTESVIVVIYR